MRHSNSTCTQPLPHQPSPLPTPPLSHLTRQPLPSLTSLVNPSPLSPYSSTPPLSHLTRQPLPSLTSLVNPSPLSPHSSTPPLSHLTRQPLPSLTSLVNPSPLSPHSSTPPLSHLTRQPLPSLTSLVNPSLLSPHSSTSPLSHLTRQPLPSLTSLVNPSPLSPHSLTSPHSNSTPFLPRSSPPLFYPAPFLPFSTLLLSTPFLPRSSPPLFYPTPLLPHPLKTQIKKLVYVYLMRYAEEQQDAALLSVSSFQKALKDPNQMIRAGALRILCGIRVPIIAPVMMLAIKESSTDMSPYVRKVAAHAIPKLYSLDPDMQEGLVEIVEKLLKDKTTVSGG